MQKIVIVLIFIIFYGLNLFAGDFELGVDAFRKSDFLNAIELFSKACDEENMKACHNLGVIYTNGYGTTQNYNKAFELFNKACEGRNKNACYSLGVLYQDGKGIQQDYLKASEMYEKTCNRGDAVVCGILGNMYNEGKIIAQNYSKANEFFEKACARGYSNGCFKQGVNYSEEKIVIQDNNKENNEVNISDENNLLYENIIKNDLDKNIRFFKKSLLSKITKVQEINHNLVNVYEINKNNLLFLITSNTPDNICHVCVPRMSWYNLKLENDIWNIKSKILSIEPNGSWGSFPVPEMIFIGKDKIAFKSIFSYGGQGTVETQLYIDEYDELNSKFRNILSIDFAFSDTGQYDEEDSIEDWNSEILIIKNDNPYYDIQISKKGKKDKMNFEEKQIYKYQNDKYNIF